LSIIKALSRLVLYFLATEFNLDEYFKPAFGINTKNNTKSTKIQLRSCYRQGQYIKSFPLHESQIIMADNSKEVVIGLSIYITWDFIKELLSLGPDLEVFSPTTFKTRMKSTQ
jgi:proteasome accessory factor B